MKLYKLKLFISKKLTKFWYWLMKPLAYFYTTKKINTRYNKKKSKITEDQAIKWIAEDIVRYAIGYKHGLDLFVCDRADRDDGDLWIGCPFPYFIKRSKTKMAYYKFNWNIEYQDKLVTELHKYKDVLIEEEVETFNSWKYIKNYQKTVRIKKKG